MKNNSTSEKIEVQGKISGRHLALLGGTTTLGDCFAAAFYLLAPWKLLKGPSVEKFEKLFAQKVGVRNGVSFSSARVGFYGLLKVLGVGKGDEVLLQVPTHIVVPNAIRYAGANPIYVDCEINSYNMDFSDAEKKVTQHSKVLLLQHTFGIPVDMDEAAAFAERHNLILIEDCVHSLGSRFKERNVGSFGRAAFFSTEETKTISTTMGGMVLTDDDKLAAEVRAFQDSCSVPSKWLTWKYLLKFVLYYFLTWPYIHRYTRAAYEMLGNFQPLPTPTDNKELRGLMPERYAQRLSNAQAAIGIRQLNKLDRNIKHRQKIQGLYSALLKNKGKLVLEIPGHISAVLVRYPILADDRELVERLTKKKFVLGKWFTSVLEEALDPKYGNYIPGSCPVAERISRTLINFPNHPRVHESDARMLIDIVSSHVEDHIR